MKLFKLNFVLALLLSSVFAIAQSSEFRFGVIGKAEFNCLKVANSDGIAFKFQPQTKFAGGIYVARSISKRFFADASVLLSAAKYTVNYAKPSAVFMDAALYYTQFNLNINYILNPNSSNTKLYIYGGGQFLFRRWGIERYMNDVLPNTYWPTNRLMTQLGVGAMCDLGNRYYLQGFAGFRNIVSRQLVYDAPVNQLYIGMVVSHSIRIDSKKKKYLTCPTMF